MWRRFPFLNIFLGTNGRDVQKLMNLHACMHDLLRKEATRILLETATEAGMFESDSFCSFASASIKTDAICDSIIATGVECHGTSFYSSGKLVRM